MNEPLCLDCKYWRSKTSEPTKETEAECRFNPPVPIALLEPSPGDGVSLHSIRSFWPETRGDQWCGQFSARA
jgi:hypothetical protein